MKKYISSKFLLCSLAVLLLIGLPNASNAEEAENHNPRDVFERVEDRQADGYVDFDYFALSRLFWVTGHYTIDNDAALLDYVKINECDIFADYIHDDFQWAAVKEDVKAHINISMKDFKREFEYVTPIFLGSYDMDGKYFNVLESSELTDVKRLLIHVEQHFNECILTKGVQTIINDAVFELYNPFTLDRVYMNENLARLYLDETAKLYEDLPNNLKLEQYKRHAYLRAKFKVDEVTNFYVSPKANLSKVFFRVRLTGYEIYADPGLTLRLYNYDKPNARKRMRETKALEEKKED